MRRHRVFARAQVAGAALVLLVAGLLSGATTAQAERFGHGPGRPPVADWGRPPVQVAPVRYADAVTSWTDCSGVLWVTFDAKDIAADRQVLVHDDAGVTFLIHDYSGRFGPGGSWFPIESYGQGSPVSGGESRVRWPGLRAALENGAHVDKVEAVRGGITSTAVVIEDRCDA